MSIDLEHLKYPIGKRAYNGSLSVTEKTKCIADIGSLPSKLIEATAKLSAAQLDTAYRPDGWTVRQVVHHLGDSHMNAFIRFKLALTEQDPAIKPYNEADWAKMDDYMIMPVEPGLELVKALHARWLVLLERLTAEDLKRHYVHPQYNKTFSLEEAIHLYAWHCNHHLAHITELKKRNAW